MQDRNPFPGMNPWLETHWGDVHHTLMSELQSQINTFLPPRMYARFRITAYEVDPVWDYNYYRPSAYFSELAAKRHEAKHPPGVNADCTARPLRLNLEIEPVKVAHIVVHDHDADDRPVTVLEVLSPVIKYNPLGRKKYLRRRRRYLRSELSLVEIDLLHGGPDLFDIPPGRVPRNAQTPCKCLIRRSTEAPAKRFELIPIALRNRVPKIAIPLRERDADAVINLQHAINMAYRLGRYGLQLDYTRPPDPPLSPEDAAWAAEVLAAAGREPKAS